MDIATILGLVLGALVMVASILLGGSPFTVFVDYPSILCVFGGAACATLVCFPLKTVRQLPKVLLKALFNQTPDIPALVKQIVSLSEIARREGLLAVENRMPESTHPFLRLGVQMTIDGTRPDVIQDILRIEIEAVTTRHQQGKGVVDQIGRFAPAFGMIGTLLGLVMMLNNMSDPSTIGSGMAVALLTTLYGTVLSNLVCLPLSEKLAFYHRHEIRALELIVKGVLAIQAGENPRIIERRLFMAVHPDSRRPLKAA